MMSSLTADLTTIDEQLARLAAQWRRAELDHDDMQAEGTRRRIDTLLEARLPVQRDAGVATIGPIT